MSKREQSYLLEDDEPNIRQNVLWALRLVFAVFMAAIFWTGLSIVKQTQERHQIHMQLRELDLQMDALRTEQQRLLIEQQTFSAIPQVAQRSVSELGMFFPTGDSRKVIAPQSKKSEGGL